MVSMQTSILGCGESWCATFSGEFSVLPSKHLLLHSSLKFPSSPFSPGSFSDYRNISSFTAPSLRYRSLSQVLCLLVFLYLLPYLVLWRLACLFWKYGDFLHVRKCSTRVVPHADRFYIIVRRKAVSLSYPSTILKLQLSIL